MDPTLIKAQRREITEHLIYKHLANKCKDKKNKGILEHISKDEKGHYEIIKRITKKDYPHYRFMYIWYIFLANVLGLTFALKLMEKEEQDVQEIFAPYKKSHPKLLKLLTDSEDHEQQVLGMLEEQRIEYAGSVVLGLNDALVELTGALAGLTFALRNGTIVAITGLITGFAASLSMAASGYLQSREEADQNKEKNPITAAIYTGIAYIITVILLVLPYFLIDNIYIALIVMLSIAIVIVLSYTYYITTAKNQPFTRRFLEMAVISLSVAALSFAVGSLLRVLFGVEI
mgnify:CR=1 FL=1|tara:strand:- start:5316 stop:6179 length:864 start_codon:yes stop_codon:yes gene_type:complete